MFSSVCFYPTSLYLLILCAVHFSNANFILNQKQHAGCGMGEYQCHSGQCIKEDLLCDGKPDCFDKSDETADACSQLHCPHFTFRCNYGACVNSATKCDGTVDCVDGSDEIGCSADASSTHARAIRKESPHSNSKSHLPVNCLIPNDPENGFYTIGDLESENYETGNAVPPFSVLVANCNYGYQTSPADNVYSVCADGIWTPIPAMCSEFPQSLPSANSETCQCYCPLVLIK